MNTQQVVSSPSGPANYTYLFYREYKENQPDVQTFLDWSPNRYCVRVPEDSNWESQCYVALDAREWAQNRTEERERIMSKACPGTFTVEEGCGYVCLSNATASEMISRGDKPWYTAAEEADISLWVASTTKYWARNNGIAAVCFSKDAIERSIKSAASSPFDKNEKLRMSVLSLVFCLLFLQQIL